MRGAWEHSDVGRAYHRAYMRRYRRTHADTPGFPALCPWTPEQAQPRASSFDMGSVSAETGYGCLLLIGCALKVNPETGQHMTIPEAQAEVQAWAQHR